MRAGDSDLDAGPSCEVDGCAGPCAHPCDFEEGVEVLAVAESDELLAGSGADEAITIHLRHDGSAVRDHDEYALEQTGGIVGLAYTPGRLWVADGTGGTLTIGLTDSFDFAADVDGHALWGSRPLDAIAVLPYRAVAQDYGLFAVDGFGEDALHFLDASAFDLGTAIWSGGLGVNAIAVTPEWLGWLDVQIGVTTVWASPPPYDVELSPVSLDLPALGCALVIVGSMAYVGTNAGLFVVDLDRL